MTKDLEQTQSLFWQLSQQPKSLSPSEIHKFIKGSSEQDSVNRLEIYAHSYFIRLHESLSEDYPALINEMGEENFYTLTVEYLKECPNTNFDITLASKGLPRFIKEKILSDLALLQWENLSITRNTDPTPTTLEHLNKISPENWGDLFFKRIEASRLLTVQTEAFTNWYKYLKQLNQKLSPLETNQSEMTHVLLWRSGFDCQFQQVSDSEHTLLNNLKDGKEFQALCDDIAVLYPGNSTKAAEFLQRWLTWGIVETS